MRRSLGIERRRKTARRSSLASCSYYSVDSRAVPSGGCTRTFCLRLAGRVLYRPRSLCGSALRPAVQEHAANHERLKSSPSGYGSVAPTFVWSRGISIVRVVQVGMVREGRWQMGLEKCELDDVTARGKCRRRSPLPRCANSPRLAVEGPFERPRQPRWRILYRMLRTSEFHSFPHSFHFSSSFSTHALVRR